MTPQSQPAPPPPPAQAQAHGNQARQPQPANAPAPTAPKKASFFSKISRKFSSSSSSVSSVPAALSVSSSHTSLRESTTSSIGAGSQAPTASAAIELRQSATGASASGSVSNLAAAGTTAGSATQLGKAISIGALANTAAAPSGSGVGAASAPLSGQPSGTSLQLQKDFMRRSSTTRSQSLSGSNHSLSASLSKLSSAASGLRSLHEEHADSMPLPAAAPQHPTQSQAQPPTYSHTHSQQPQPQSQHSFMSLTRSRVRDSSSHQKPPPTTVDIAKSQSSPHSLLSDLAVSPVGEGQALSASMPSAKLAAAASESAPKFDHVRSDASSATQFGLKTDAQDAPDAPAQAHPRRPSVPCTSISPPEGVSSAAHKPAPARTSPNIVTTTQRGPLRASIDAVRSPLSQYSAVCSPRLAQAPTSANGSSSSMLNATTEGRRGSTPLGGSHPDIAAASLDRLQSTATRMHALNAARQKSGNVAGSGQSSHTNLIQQQHPSAQVPTLGRPQSGSALAGSGSLLSVHNKGQSTPPLARSGSIVASEGVLNLQPKSPFAVTSQAPAAVSPTLASRSKHDVAQMDISLGSTGQSALTTQAALHKQSSSSDAAPDRSGPSSAPRQVPLVPASQSALAGHRYASSVSKLQPGGVSTASTANSDGAPRTASATQEALRSQPASEQPNDPPSNGRRSRAQSQLNFNPAVIGMAQQHQQALTQQGMLSPPLSKVLQLGADSSRSATPQRSRAGSAASTSSLGGSHPMPMSMTLGRSLPQTVASAAASSAAKATTATPMRFSAGISAATLGDPRSRSASTSAKPLDMTPDDLLAKLRAAVGPRLTSPNSQQTIQSEAGLSGYFDAAAADARRPESASRSRAQTWTNKSGMPPPGSPGSMSGAQLAGGLRSATQNLSTISSSGEPEPPSPPTMATLARGASVSQARGPSQMSFGRAASKSAFDYSKMGQRPGGAAAPLSVRTVSFQEASVTSPAGTPLSLQAHLSFTPSPRSPFAPASMPVSPFVSSSGASASLPRNASGRSAFDGKPGIARPHSSSIGGASGRPSLQRPRNYSNASASGMPASMLHHSAIAGAATILASDEPGSRASSVAGHARSPLSTSIDAASIAAEHVNGRSTARSSESGAETPSQDDKARAADPPLVHTRSKRAATVSGSAADLSHDHTGSRRGSLNASKSSGNLNSPSDSAHMQAFAISEESGSAQDAVTGVQASAQAAVLSRSMGLQPPWLSTDLETIVSRSESPAGSKPSLNHRLPQKMGQSQNAKLGSQLLATSRSTEALRKTDAGLAVQRTDTGLPITPVLTRQQSQIAILGPDDEPISIPSSTADLAQRGALDANAISVPASSRALDEDRRPHTLPRQASRRKLTDGSAPPDKQFLHAKSFRIDDEGASPRSSVVSERSSVIERPSTCVVPEDEIDPDLDPVFVRCFPRSASGLCLLEPGWDTQVFADPKYNIWRRCVLEILQQQIDYPLIMPADLAAAINDEFGDF